MNLIADLELDPARSKDRSIDARAALIRWRAIALVSFLLAVAGCAGRQPHGKTVGPSSEPEQCQDLRDTVVGVAAQAPFARLPLGTHHEVERLGDELKALGCSETPETARVFATTRSALEVCARRFSDPASTNFDYGGKAGSVDMYFIAAGIDSRSETARRRTEGVVALLQVMSGTIFRNAKVEAAFRIREIKTSSVQGIVLKEAGFEWFQNRSASDLFSIYCR